MHTDHLQILCISPVFPPWADSEAFCGGKMVKALTDAGHDIVVLCEPPSPQRLTDGSLCWKQLEPVRHCIEVPPTWRGNIRQMFSEACHGLLYRNLGRGRHVENYVRYAKKLHHERHFDVVYSRSLPMYAHMAGYWCSRSLGLPWIANMNDPWDMHLFPESDPRHVSARYAAVSRHWLRTTLRRADLITYPSSHLHRFHMQLAAMRHEAEVVPHIGYAANSRDRAICEFCIVHAGKLGARELTGRSTVGLFTGLAQFLRARPSARDVTHVVLVGPEDPLTNDVVKQVGLEDVVKSVGRLSYEESLVYIASASLCVLVEGRMTDGIYFPSKLADYIAARKPILALSPARGVAAELAREGDIRRVDADDEEAIASAIGDYYRAFLDGRLRESSPSDALARQVSPYAVAEKFLHAVESVCRKLV